MKLIYSFLLGFLPLTNFAQMDGFNYFRPIKIVENEWNKIILPQDILSKTKQQYDDIRIIGIDSQNDTFEQDFIRKNTQETSSIIYFDLNIINRAIINGNQSFTIQNKNHRFNTIDLGIEEANFDCVLKIEGSQNLEVWELLKDNYQIIGFKNQNADYRFTSINLSEYSYPYIRVSVLNQKKITVKSARIAFLNNNNQSLLNLPIKSFKILNHKDKKTTTIDLELKYPSSICALKLQSSNSLFYRPVQIEYLIDSFKKPNGFYFNYAYLASGIFSSLESKNFEFNEIICRQLRITINNFDSKPLTINDLMVYGYEQYLISKIDKKAKYFLCYSHLNKQKPIYDLNFIGTKDVKTVLVQLDKEQKVLNKAVKNTTEPIFTNKIWLWLVLIVLVLILGWFSVKMLK